MLRAALAILLIAGGFQTAAAEVRGVFMHEPRAMGYFLGDTITRTAEIETGADDEILAAALPHPGLLNYWLELRDVALSSERRGDGKVHKLTLTYQTFYTPLDTRRLAIPSSEISVRTGDSTESAKIPAFSFVMSPLREVLPQKFNDEDGYLLPDSEPEKRRSGTLRTAALAMAGLAALFLILLARDLAWWPFNRRPARPFSRAAREVSRVLGTESGEGYRHALLALHRAFDSAAGRRVLASDLDRFLVTHPEHGPNRIDVERFFAASRTVFFGDAEREGKTSLPPSELRALAVALARQERAAR